MPPCSRRQFISCASLIVPALTACSRDVTEPFPSVADDGVELFPDHIRIDLNRQDALAASGGSLVLGAEHIIVVHGETKDFRAFSNVCTHAGCGIGLFLNRRMRCQCHGSEFDLEGTNVAGPAPSPLKRYDCQLGADNSLRIALT